MRMVREYDLRKGQRWSTAPEWVPTPGVMVASDGHWFEVDGGGVQSEAIAIRGSHSFAEGACHWRVRIKGPTTIYSGVVDVTLPMPFPQKDYSNTRVAYVGTYNRVGECTRIETCTSIEGVSSPNKRHEGMRSNCRADGFLTIDFHADLATGELRAVFNGSFAPQKPLFTGLDLKRFAPYCAVFRRDTEPVFIESEDE